MANPTTNFGWVMPTSSSLVTNLPADFNTFGQAVDTSMSELLGGTTGQVLSKTSNTNMDFTWVTPTDQTPLTTKGDLFTFTTVDARLGVGANDTVLTADSSTSTGLKWATPAAGGMTSIATGTLSGASVTLSSIAGTYKNLQLVLNNFSFSASGNNVKFTANSITSYSVLEVASGTSGGAIQTAYGQAATEIYIYRNSIVQTPTASSAVANFYSYSNTSAYKIVDIQCQADRGGGLQGINMNTAVVNATAAITSITIGALTGTFSGGTYTLYGVS